MEIEIKIKSDEPTSHDALDRDKFAKAISSVVKTCDTPLVLGLYGTWGMGKTSLMKQVEAMFFDSSLVTPVWFDPWQHQFDEDPAVALLHTMIEQLNLGDESKKILSVIASALGSIFLKATTTLNIAEIQSLGEKYEEERFQVREKQIRIRQHFSDLIDQATDGGKSRLVFFVDDLDRCAPEQILRVLEALKLYLNLPNCVYLLGVDRSALEESIKLRYKDLSLSEADYLDKIVQLPFTIPPIARESMEKFISPLLADDLQDVVPLLVKGLGDNPRQVKRFINTLLLNHQLASEMLGESYKPKQLTVILLIQYRQPEIYKLVIKDPSLLLNIENNSSDKGGEILGKDNALKEVIPLAEFMSSDEMASYIYLSEVASVRQVEFDVFMTSFGKDKVAAIKVIKGILGLGLLEAKELVESAPCYVSTNLTKEASDDIKSQLIEAGASVEIK